MSDSDSDSDSGDSDKEIVVRHAGVRDPTVAQVLRVAEPKVLFEDPIHQTTKLSQPDRQSKSSTHIAENEVENQRVERADVEEARTRLPSLARSTSEDSMSSVISVREDDVHILMRTIPEYGQYSDKEAKRNDSYLRSALQHMPQDLLDYTDEFGNSLLLIASQYSCADLVRILLQRGANPHKINSSGASCLHFACYKDSLSMPIVELLLEQGVSVNVAETLYGCTPLHYAASTGELALCQLLIQHGAYIHAHDFDNCSSIDYAIDAGMMELADYLRAAQNATHTTTITSSVSNQPTGGGNNNSKWEDALSPNGSVMHSLHDANVKKSAESSTPVAPGSSVFRMIVNTNNSSLDEFDPPPTYTAPFSPNPLPNNNSSVEVPGSTSSYRVGYSKPPLPTPTYASNANETSSANGSVNGSAKSSPSVDRHSDQKLSPDGPSSVKSTNSSPGATDTATPGMNVYSNIYAIECNSSYHINCFFCFTFTQGMESAIATNLSPHLRTPLFLFLPPKGLTVITRVRAVAMAVGVTAV